ncbi:hypothetical protein THRCLA_20403 [Thraustotheca clavata]|uniref:Uncharacterized protein n=1 Tax=Thraustotheca clavata TaxID=74557 RepID=A0A1W0A7Q0_9STRA|nr:hypothetical protein THRCLA_20403 [Thraustotheca clavata]
MDKQTELEQVVDTQAMKDEAKNDEEKRRQSNETNAVDEQENVVVKRGRGRPRKYPVKPPVPEGMKRGRGRPRKIIENDPSTENDVSTKEDMAKEDSIDKNCTNAQEKIALIVQEKNTAIVQDNNGPILRLKNTPSMQEKKALNMQEKRAPIVQENSGRILRWRDHPIEQAKNALDDHEKNGSQVKNDPIAQVKKAQEKHGSIVQEMVNSFSVVKAKTVPVVRVALVRKAKIQSKLITRRSNRVRTLTKVMNISAPVSPAKQFVPNPLKRVLRSNTVIDLASSEDEEPKDEKMVNELEHRPSCTRSEPLKMEEKEIEKAEEKAVELPIVEPRVEKVKQAAQVEKINRSPNVENVVKDAKVEKVENTLPVERRHLRSMTRPPVVPFDIKHVSNFGKKRHRSEKAILTQNQESNAQARKRRRSLRLATIVLLCDDEQVDKKQAISTDADEENKVKKTSQTQHVETQQDNIKVNHEPEPEPKKAQESKPTISTQETKPKIATSTQKSKRAISTSTQESKRTPTRETKPTIVKSTQKSKATISTCTQESKPTICTSTQESKSTFTQETTPTMSTATQQSKRTIPKPTISTIIQETKPTMSTCQRGAICTTMQDSKCTMPILSSKARSFPPLIINISDDEEPMPPKATKVRKHVIKHDPFAPPPIVIEDSDEEDDIVCIKDLQDPPKPFYESLEDDPFAICI